MPTNAIRCVNLRPSANHPSFCALLRFPAAILHLCVPYDLCGYIPWPVYIRAALPLGTQHTFRLSCSGACWSLLRQPPQNRAMSSDVHSADICSPASLWRRRRNRRLRRQGIKYFGDIPIVMQPWRPASQISIKPLHAGTWLVKLTQDKDWKERSFRLGSPPQCWSFEFDLSEARQKHVTTQMATWPVNLDLQMK